MINFKKPAIVADLNVDYYLIKYSDVPKLDLKAIQHDIVVKVRSTDVYIALKIRLKGNPIITLIERIRKYV